eukprot:jgi/Mesvir1/28277/Mv04801-RA.1
MVAKIGQGNPAGHTVPGHNGNIIKGNKSSRAWSLILIIHLIWLRFQRWPARWRALVLTLIFGWILLATWSHLSSASMTWASHWREGPLTAAAKPTIVKWGGQLAKPEDSDAVVEIVVPEEVWEKKRKDFEIPTPGISLEIVHVDLDADGSSHESPHVVPVPDHDTPSGTSSQGLPDLPSLDASSNVADAPWGSSEGGRHDASRGDGPGGSASHGSHDPYSGAEGSELHSSEPSLEALLEVSSEHPLEPFSDASGRSLGPSSQPLDEPADDIEAWGKKIESEMQVLSAALAQEERVGEELAGTLESLKELGEELEEVREQGKGDESDSDSSDSDSSYDDDMPEGISAEQGEENGQAGRGKQEGVDGEGSLASAWEVSSRGSGGKGGGDRASHASYGGGATGEEGVGGGVLDDQGGERVPGVDHADGHVGNALDGQAGDAMIPVNDGTLVEQEDEVDAWDKRIKADIEALSVALREDKARQQQLQVELEELAELDGEIATLQGGVGDEKDDSDSSSDSSDSIEEGEGEDGDTAGEGAAALASVTGMEDMLGSGGGQGSLEGEEEMGAVGQDNVGSGVEGGAVDEIGLGVVGEASVAAEYGRGEHASAPGGAIGVAQVGEDGDGDSSGEEVDTFGAGSDEGGAVVGEGGCPGDPAVRNAASSFFGDSAAAIAESGGDDGLLAHSGAGGFGAGIDQTVGAGVQGGKDGDGTMLGGGDTPVMAGGLDVLRMVAEIDEQEGGMLAAEGTAAGGHGGMLIGSEEQFVVLEGARGSDVDGGVEGVEGEVEGDWFADHLGGEGRADFEDGVEGGVTEDGSEPLRMNEDESLADDLEPAVGGDSQDGVNDGLEGAEEGEEQQQGSRQGRGRQRLGSASGGGYGEDGVRAGPGKGQGVLSLIGEAVEDVPGPAFEGGDSSEGPEDSLEGPEDLLEGPQDGEGGQADGASEDGNVALGDDGGSLPGGGAASLAYLGEARGIDVADGSRGAVDIELMLDVDETAEGAEIPEGSGEDADVADGSSEDAVGVDGSDDGGVAGAVEEGGSEEEGGEEDGEEEDRAEVGPGPKGGSKWESLEARAYGMAHEDEHDGELDGGYAVTGAGAGTFAELESQLQEEVAAEVASELEEEVEAEVEDELDSSESQLDSAESQDSDVDDEVGPDVEGVASLSSDDVDVDVVTSSEDDVTSSEEGAAASRGDYASIEGGGDRLLDIVPIGGDGGGRLAVYASASSAEEDGSSEDAGSSDDASSSDDGRGTGYHRSHLKVQPELRGGKLGERYSDSLATPEFVYGGKWNKIRSRVSFTSEPTPSAHAATLLHLAGGAVLMAWFGGTFEGAEDVAIWASVRMGSVGDDEYPPFTWSQPKLAAKVHREVPFNGGPSYPSSLPREGGEPHWNPVLFCGEPPQAASDSMNAEPDSASDSDEEAVDLSGGPTVQGCRGPILLFFKVGWQIPSWETYVTQSANMGLTWSEPVPLVPGDRGGRGPVKNKPIWLSDGRTILAGASLEETPDAPIGRRARRDWRAFVDRSEDGGQTWERTDEIRVQDPSWGIIQPTLWESSPGRVHMLLRSTPRPDAQVWRSDSSDGGLTWVNPYRMGLPNNNAGLDVVRLPYSGTLVLAFNPTTSGRTPLRLSISRDNGFTWSRGVDIEDERVKPGQIHQFSYPSIVAWPCRSADEEGVSVGYTWHRKRIAFFSISMKDLAARLVTHTYTRRRARHHRKVLGVEGIVQ